MRLTTKRAAIVAALGVCLAALALLFACSRPYPVPPPTPAVVTVETTVEVPVTRIVPVVEVQTAPPQYIEVTRVVTVRAPYPVYVPVTPTPPEVGKG